MSQITKTTTLLVIGGGPGGYVAAIRAGQLGVPTILVEGAQLGSHTLTHSISHTLTQSPILTHSPTLS